MARSNLPAVVAPAQLASASSIGSLFAGFDDYMERFEPGWKARIIAERRDREQKRLERRAAIIDRYGSEEAVLAPCRAETLLAQALDPWRTTCAPPWERWTRAIEGYRSFLDPLPEHLAKAVAAAYPLPSTFGEALTEYRYWQNRRSELDDLLGPESDDPLDLVAQLRFGMVCGLAEHELPTTTLIELHQRFQLLRDSEIDEPKIEAALFRDLSAMVQLEATS